MNKTCAWHPERSKKNVAGDFYTIEDGCLACMLPEGEAPTLLNADEEEYETFFIRQPQTPEEIEQACCAIEVCCTEALRYGGKDKAIIKRLGNKPAYCDYNLEGKLNNIQSTFYGKWYRRLAKYIVFKLVNKIT
jgi:hypothetical protein